jgi:putative spermidine/putrescine transport system permease protein
MLNLFFGWHPVARALFLALCGLVFVFLLGPMLVIVPLSFNSEPYFTLPMAGVSTRWYEAFFTSDNWLLALKNSLLVATAACGLSVVLGTAAAIGLSGLDGKFRRPLMTVLLAPMAMPLVISGIAIYFAYAKVGLTGTMPGLILAHTLIASPFVVMTVSASLATFDKTLLRAAASLGAGGWTAFRRVMLPLIFPGVGAGAVFSFVASFDDLVVTLFVASTEQRTIPRQMWSGVRENLDPTILSVATLFVLLSAVVTLTTTWLRTRTAAPSSGASPS